MTNFKKITLLFFLFFLTNCGYAPLLNSDNSNFYINNLVFEGDRQVNNNILDNLKKYQHPKENSKSYNINILSKYSKTITNKDDSGNPKNYNIKAKVEIKYFAKEENEKNETFERSINLSAQNKKITEKEMENKYKKDLSNLLSQDIVFLLKNQ